MELPNKAALAAIKTGELVAHQDVLRARRRLLTKQLDAGVPRARYAKVHAALTAVTAADDALDQVQRAAAG